MRKTFSLLFLFLALNALQAQTVRGIIRNAPRDYVVLKTSDKYWLTGKTDTVKLRKDGSFTFLAKLNSPVINGSLEIAPKRSFPIWLTENKSLVVTINDTSLVPVFSGELKRINEYLQEERPYQQQTLRDYIKRNANYATYASSRSKEYFVITDSLTSDQLLFLEQSIGNPKNSSEQNFVAQRKKDLIIQNLFYKISYDNPPLEKLIFYQKQFNVTSPTSFAYSSEISFNDPNLLSRDLLSFSRMFFMELVFRYQQKEKIKLTKDAFYDRFFTEVDRLSKNKFCNAILKASFIKEEIDMMALTQNATISTYGRFVDTLLSYPHIKKEAKFIEGVFQRKANDLYAKRNGEPAPSTVLTDTSGNALSLENFKGKLLYIDVWATWCKPCIESVPYWNKLVDKYKNNSDVAFITVSTDEAKDKEKWTRLLKQYKFKGVHFISPGGTESEFSKKFLVFAYPTNILIDKAGRIISIKAESPDTIDLSPYLKQ